MYEIREAAHGWFHTGQIVDGRWVICGAHASESGALDELERLNNPGKRYAASEGLDPDAERLPFTTTKEAHDYATEHWDEWLIFWDGYLVFYEDGLDDVLELGGSKLSQEATSILPGPSAEGVMEITIIKPRKGIEVAFPGLFTVDILLENLAVSPERFGEIWGDGEVQGMPPEDT